MSAIDAPWAPRSAILDWVLPLGLAPGQMRNWARHSREVWLHLAEWVGFWLDPVGALIVAYNEDELAVLQEFVEQVDGEELPCHLLNKLDVLALCRTLRPDGLLGGLFSPTDLVVDPREAMATLAHYLAHTYDLTLCFGQTVIEIELPYIRTGADIWRVERVVVCSGTDFETLYPDLFRDCGLTRCKLQMLRTEPQPNNWRLGPALMTGLSLNHYPAFANCPSLPFLKQRIAADYPVLEHWGIHLLAVQNGVGEVIIGDSHQYNLSPEPFDRTEIDHLILAYLRQILNFL